MYLKGDHIDYVSLNQEFGALLSNPNRIKNAYKYLVKLDKTKFSIDYFVNEFLSVINKIK